MGTRDTPTRAARRLICKKKTNIQLEVRGHGYTRSRNVHVRQRAGHDGCLSVYSRKGHHGKEAEGLVHRIQPVPAQRVVARKVSRTEHFLCFLKKFGEKKRQSK